jgi:hypothetical protein
MHGLIYRLEVRQDKEGNEENKATKKTNTTIKANTKIKTKKRTRRDTRLTSLCSGELEFTLPDLY